MNQWMESAVRWSPPETFHGQQQLTIKSDVWSFGIVIWEVMSYGDEPYWTWSNYDVIGALRNNFRLPTPVVTINACFLITLNLWPKNVCRISV